MNAAPATVSNRRADIDYLRVGALVLLIIFHTLLVYNSWDWWRVKSSYAGGWADYITGLVMPWRMALVFFIGGVAARFMIERSSTGGFIRERASKLLTAFVFAVIALVPLQRYVRLDDDGHRPESYIQYLLHESRYAVQDFGIWLPDFAHVWFLPYLFAYSVLAILLLRGAPRLMARLQRSVETAPFWLLIGGVMALFALAEAVILPRFPTTGLLIPDLGAHAKFAPLFMLGLLLAKSAHFTERMLAVRLRLWTAAAALLALTLLLKGDFVDYGEPTSVAHGLWMALRGCYGGVMLFGVLAFAARWLNKPSPVLTYAADAILPVYLMHQTVLVVAADAIVPRHWPLLIELPVLVAATGLIPLLLYHTLVRETPALRVLFGLRPHARDGRPREPESPQTLPDPLTR